MSAPAKPRQPYELPAAALAEVDALVACAPPLSESQERLIQRALGPALARIAQRAARQAQAA